MKSKTSKRQASVNLTDYPQAYLVPVLLKVLGDSLTNGHGAGPILDLGCGDGVLAQFLELQGYTVIGIDADKSKVRAAKKRDPAGHYAIGFTADTARFRPLLAWRLSSICSTRTNLPTRSARCSNQEG